MLIPIPYLLTRQTPLLCSPNKKCDGLKINVCFFSISICVIQNRKQPFIYSIHISEKRKRMTTKSLLRTKIDIKRYTSCHPFSYTISHIPYTKYSFFLFYAIMFTPISSYSTILLGFQPGFLL